MAPDYYVASLPKPLNPNAARGWLGWSQQELAAAASVGLSTVKDFEAGRRTPMGNNLKAMRSAMEESGIEFRENGIDGPAKKADPD